MVGLSNSLLELQVPGSRLWYSRFTLGRLLIVVVTAATIVVLPFLSPITQDVHYHEFADRRTIVGIPNFWNVISNLPFLLAALWGLRALRSSEAFLESWERTAYYFLLGGVALITFGSGYYHLSPDNGTLSWDRLPMTIAFMSLLATTLGERISARAGRLLLFPLLAVGAGSVLYWKYSGDLRLYALVQFYPLLALPLMLILFPPRYSGTTGIVAMIALYASAKIFEWYDYRIASATPIGGHALKHLAAAAAMLCYVNMVAHRRQIFRSREGSQDTSSTPPATIPSAG